MTSYDVKDEPFSEEELESEDDDLIYSCDTEIVEVEINPRELSFFLEELSRIKKLKTQVVQNEGQVTLGNQVIQTQEFKVSEVDDDDNEDQDNDLFTPEDDYCLESTEEEDIKKFSVEPDNDFLFNPVDEHQLIDDGHCDDIKKPIEPKDDIFSQEIDLDNFTELSNNLREEAQKERFSLTLKKLDDYFLQKFLKTKHQHVRVQLLTTIIDNHARAEKFPTISEPTKLDQGQFMCPKCYGIYSERKLVVRHMKEVHSSNHTRIKCEHCPKSFAHFGALTTHVNQIHSNIFRYDCPKCPDFKSQRKIPLIEHLVVVHGVEEEDVDKLIKSNYRLNNASKKHSLKETCPLCRKEFLDEESLSKHLCIVRHRINENLGKIEKIQGLLSCPLCAQSFEAVESLKDHYVSLHAQDCAEFKTYQEEVRISLEKRQHKKKEHVVVKVEPDLPMSILCEQCPFTASSSKQLEQHLVKVHQQK